MRFWNSEEGHNQIYDTEHAALLKDDLADRQNKE
jgi:hypothetical protein